MVGNLKEHEAGAKMANLLHRHGISEQSFYRWKSKYGGMEVRQAKRLHKLESENVRLKQLLPEADLGKTTLKDMLGGKVERPTARKRLASCRQQIYVISERRAS